MPKFENAPDILQWSRDISGWVDTIRIAAEKGLDKKYNPCLQFSDVYLLIEAFRLPRRVVPRKLRLKDAFIFDRMIKSKLYRKLWTLSPSILLFPWVPSHLIFQKGI